MQPTTKRIQRLLATGNKEQLKHYVSIHHAVDVAAAITLLRPENILNVIEAIGNTRGKEIFEALEMDTRKTCLDYAEPERIIPLFEHMSTDEQTDLLKLLDPEARHRILALLDKPDREDLMRLAKFEEGTAGSEMTTEFFALNPEMTVAEALTEIKKRYEEAETIYTIYVTDDRGALVGVLSLKDLVLAHSEKPLRQIMNPNVISATVHEDVEEVARKIQKYDLLAMPVVNAARELRGIITVDDVIDIIEEETTEDIYAMGAVGAPISYMGSGPLSIARQRITWLIVLIFSGFIAGIILKLFHNLLDAHVILMFFIPMINGSAGNAGTQTTTVIVRGLATGELDHTMILKILLKELQIGAMVGAVMGVFSSIYIEVMYRRPDVAISVGLAMIFVISMAKTIGSMLPILLKKLKLDPAIMSGPLLASISDIIAIVTYLTIAKLFIPVI